METQIQNKLMCDTSTQTDPHSNKGKDFSVLDESKHADLFTAIDNTPYPDYRLNLMRVFNEEFIAENSKKDLGPFIDLLIKKDWNTLKKLIPSFTKFIVTYSLLHQVAYYMIANLSNQQNFDQWCLKLSTVNTPDKREC